MQKKWFKIYISLCFSIILISISAFASAAHLSGEWSYQADQEKNMLSDSEIVRQADGDGWKDFDFPKSPPFPIDGGRLWLKTRVIQDENQGDNMLLFQTRQSVFSLWFDGKLIYSYGNPFINESGRGARWHLVNLPPFNGSANILFEMKYPDPAALAPFNYFSIDSAFSQTERSFLYDLPIALSLPLTVLLIILLSVYYFEESIWKNLYRAVILFLLMFSFWMLSISELIQVHTKNSLVLDYAQYILMYGMPLCANFLILEVIEKKWHKIIKATSAVLLSLLIGSIGMEICSHIGFVFGTISYIIAFPITDSIALFCLWRSSKGGNPRSKTLCVPLLAFMGFAVIDHINNMVNFLPFYFRFEPFAIFFSLYFILQLLHDQLLKEQDLAVKASRLKKKAADATRRSETDALTQCWNRAKFDVVLQEMTSSGEDLKTQKLAFIIFDIDHFKSFNDDFGHKMGDQVLSRFAGIVRLNLDESKHFFRWGGEEFVILFYCRDMLRAAQLGDKIRKAIENAELCEKRAVTVSVGVSFWHGTGDTIKELFERADAALYRAKSEGRNCLRLEEAEQ